MLKWIKAANIKTEESSFVKCPTCNQATDEGAAYCGNCGQRLQVARNLDTQTLAPRYGTVLAPLALAGAQGVPVYAFTRVTAHAGETKAVLSLVLGIIGIACSLFMALPGLALGVAGIVLGTMARASHKRAVSLTGIIISCIAVLTSLAVWSYVVVHNVQAERAMAPGRNATPPNATVGANSVTTPCYTAGFTNQLNIATAEDSCDMQAFDGATLDNSSNAYKVYGYKQPALESNNFLTFAKQALEKDVKDNLPGFTIDNQTVGQFAGKPAYIINASSKENGVAYVEAAVLHKDGVRENVFVFVHAIAGKSVTDLRTLESQWQWK